MQTFIERYIEQGKQTGMELGLARGRQEGQAVVLLRQIERTFGPPSEAFGERIAGADAETILQWSDRILTAESLDGLLH